MKTEREIIYQILNTARDAEHNLDERTGERLLRSYLRKYRGESLRKHYKNGVTVEDQVFQLIPLQLKKIGTTNEFMVKIPKIIRLEDHYGFYLEKDGVTIPIVDSEKYNLSKRNAFGKDLVQSKTEGNNLILWGGLLSAFLQSGDNTYLVKAIINEIKPQQNNTDILINVNFFGVLSDPSDCPGYDWENDIYPFPDERLPELEMEILRKEFGIMVQGKRDEISNSRNDSIRYHDNEDVSNNG